MKKAKNQLLRPPVVAFMGHIDHGKTSILDRIRQSEVQKREAGGITQGISACQVEWQGQKITFIDTPGHEIFDNIRARGAAITDLAVLVIAADEGVMPQTEESLRHLQKAQVPFLIALNKIDLPQAQPEKVKDQLLKLGVLVEDRGGEVVLVPVSAKTGEGLDDLLEMIILLAQINEVEKKSFAATPAVVLESLVNPRRGVEELILVREGKLSLGETVASEGQTAKIRAMFDWQGKAVKTAGPSQPVWILGFSQPLPAGAIVKKGTAETTSKEESPLPSSASLKKGFLNLVIKVDSLGSQEAILAALEGEKVNILSIGVGDIGESDLLLASSFQGLILGFRVRLTKRMADLAKKMGVTVKTFSLIYDFLKFVGDEVEKIIKKKEAAAIAGEAEIIALFDIEGKKIAGGRVNKGVIVLGEEVQLWREGRLIGKTKIVSLKQRKKDVRKVSQGEEMGMIFSPLVDFRKGDMIRYVKSDSDRQEDKNE